MKIYTKKFSIGLIVTFLLFVLSACQRDYYNKFILISAFNTTNTVEIFSKSPISEKEREIIKEDMDTILIDLDNIFNIQERQGQKLETVLYEIAQKWS